MADAEADSEPGQLVSRRTPLAFSSCQRRDGGKMVRPQPVQGAGKEHGQEDEHGDGILLELKPQMKKTVHRATSIVQRE
jgi:hypothetical protein